MPKLDLTDAEVARVLGERAAKEEKVLLENQRVASLEGLTLEMVNLLAPRHTQLRYNKACNDSYRGGGLDHKFAGKEWRCTRCCLLDIVSNPLYYDDVCGPLYLHLTLEGAGNVH